MAETTTDNPHSHSGRNPLILAALVLLLIAVLGFMYHQNKQQKAASTPPTGWAEYKSDQYGFKFSYPESWGQANFSKSISKNQTEYNIDFVPRSNLTDKKTSINIIMTPSATTDVKCKPSDGCTTGDVDKSYIESRIKNDTADLAAFDSTSYANVISIPKNVSAMSVYQIVDLSKAKISSVKLSYEIRNPNATCPQNGFAKSGTPGCITKDIYDTASKSIKTLKSL